MNDFLTRLQHWIDQLEVASARASLRRLLPAITVGLVLLVAGAVSLSAIGLLRSMANTQGLTRVQLAGTSAREELRNFSEDALTQVRAIAANEALRRVLSENPQAQNTLAAMLTRSCKAAALNACALVRDDQLLAVSSEAPDWQSVITSAREQGERFLNVASERHVPVLGASATALPNNAFPQLAVRIFGVRFLDDRLAVSLGERVGVSVSLVNYITYSKAPVDSLTRLHAAALADGRYAAERNGDLDQFAASVPLFAATGEAIVLIDTRMSTDEIDASTGVLVKRLVIITITVGLLAILGGLIVGQVMARPIQNLTDAASRIAKGDYSTSIPATGPQEVGLLARTMEDMRRNLVDVTSALRRSEAEAQAVLSGIVEGVYAVDRSRTITYINPQGARMLGRRAEEIVGRFCGDVLKPCVNAQGERPCETLCPILQARQAGSAQAAERLQIGTGSPRTALITSAAPVEGLQVQVMRDETEVEATRRARDSVLANISHEFRTPLAAQLASIELLLDGLDDLQPQQVRELVMSLERGTQRLTNLIDNLLESVRIEAGQLSIRHQAVALQDVVSEAQSLMGSLLNQRQQELRIELPDDLPLVDGDEVRLTQVFVNLLANACKYAPEQSNIHIGAHADAQWVTAWVEDEGPGVPADHGEAIFEPFTRGPGHEPEPGGLGLGLAIVRSIVQRHGGLIGVQRTPEQRTRFSFTLPRIRDNA